MKRVLLSCVMIMLILCLFAGCVQPASTEEVTPTAVVSPSVSPRQTPEPFWDAWVTVRNNTPEYGSISSSMEDNFGEKEGVSYRYHFSSGNPFPDGFTFTALPNEGCRFDGWYYRDKLLSTDLIYIFTSGSFFDVVAVFSPIDEP